MRAIGKILLLSTSLLFCCQAAIAESNFYDHKATLQYVRNIVSIEIIKKENENTNSFLQRLIQAKNEFEKKHRITLISECTYDTRSEEMLCYTPFLATGALNGFPGGRGAPVLWDKQLDVIILALNGTAWDAATKHAQISFDILPITAKMPREHARQLKNNLYIVADIIPVLLRRSPSENTEGTSSGTETYRFFEMKDLIDKKVIHITANITAFHMMDTKTGKIYGTLKPENTR